MDMDVEDLVVLELKYVQKLNPVFDLQILSYIKLGSYKLGLLINFKKKLLMDGIKPFMT